MSKLPIVALIGRVNVGKSTLFNRLSEEHKAIVSPYPGTTRDLITAELGWNQKYFHIVDCGGLEETISDDTSASIQKQTRRLIEEADLIVWIIDGKSPILRQDQGIATFLRALRKPLIVGVNKIDTFSDRKNFDMTLTLGFPTHVLFSAKNGSGTGDLLDTITAMLPSRKKVHTTSMPRITILGKPNVGKSSLLNALKGKEVRVVSRKPHTTRDSGDIEILWHKKSFLFTDTAGVRRKSKVGAGFLGDKATQKLLAKIEHEGIMQSLRHIDDADLIILLLDISQDVSQQDQLLGALIARLRKPAIIVGNKWDLIPNKTTQTMKRLTAHYHAQFPHLSFAPLVLISATEKQHLYTIMETIEFVLAEKNKYVAQELLTSILYKCIRRYPPKKSSGIPGTLKKPLKIKQLTQSTYDPLILELTTPYPKALAKSWIDLLEKELRNQFQWTGCPLLIIPKK